MRRGAVARAASCTGAVSIVIAGASSVPPSARSTMRSSASSWNGFSRKSNAPMRITRTAVSMVPWPEITITGTSGACWRIFETSSMPSISGIQMSTIASRGTSRSSSSSARRPSCASTTS
jgi:hypothetical protein